MFSSRETFAGGVDLQADNKSTAAAIVAIFFNTIKFHFVTSERYISNCLRISQNKIGVLLTNTLESNFEADR